jgi:UDP-N-acetyl-D-galactosamine dehydrogenase
MQLADVHLAVIGLGYVGLPVAVAFGQRRSVVGFDINLARIQQLREGQDLTLETASEERASATQLVYTDRPEDLAPCNFFIITVPTPVDDENKPDLRPLISATETVSTFLKKGDVVVYESTVYPGCTEEVCVPAIEKRSGLKFNIDFFCGYSPERINPGDKSHRLQDIVKITSGSTIETADLVDALYQEIVLAGTHRAGSIKIAEAAKVIENTQRDLNIALINEFALIFNKLNIDTSAVLRAAGTKWNFLPFKPGLVGGHCIGIDPYYLTHKAQQIGYEPKLILAGRELNDSMSAYVADRLCGELGRRNPDRLDQRFSILVLGLTFKENCPDVRNSQIFNLIGVLDNNGHKVEAYDPVANQEVAGKILGNKLLQYPEVGLYDGIILAVAHREFLEMTVSQIEAFGKPSAVIYDVKSVLPQPERNLRL